MIDKAAYESEIRKHLSDYRFYHSLEVAKSAVELAERYGADLEKAYIAGILHDIMKDASKSEQFEIFEKYGIKLSPLEKSGKKFWHAMSGAVYIEKKLGISDSEILDAVRYHTTGRARMALLEKVIFIADFISADREYDGVERMREKAKISLELAMLEGFQFTIVELLKDEKPVHPYAIEAYNEIVKNKEYKRRKIDE